MSTTSPDPFEQYVRRDWMVLPSVEFEVGHGYRASEAVLPDGSVFFGLRDMTAAKNEWARCYECPPDHEELGPVPDDVWWRLHPTPTRVRCGADTRDGRPCGQIVAVPGDRCHWHREGR